MTFLNCSLYDISILLLQIDGLPFVKLEYVVQWKKQFASEKDLRDVELVKGFQLKQFDKENN